MGANIEIPKVGQKIYIGGSCHLYRGCDDVSGGLSEIEKVELSDHLPPEHYNYISVVVKGIPRVRYNYKALLEKQEEYENKYGLKESHIDPDNRPEFNNQSSDWRLIY